MSILNFNSKRQKFKKILNVAFDSKYKKKLVVTVIFMLCGILLELCGIGLIFPALKLITDQEFLNNAYAFIGVSNLKVTTLLIIITLFFIFFYGFKNFFLWLVLKNYSNFLSTYEAYVQSNLYEGYFKKSVSYFKEKNSSDIIINIKEISSYFSAVYLNSIMIVSIEILLQFSILVMLFYFSWQSTLMIFILFGGLAIFLYSYFQKKLAQLGKIRNELSEEQLRNLQDGIGGIKEIKLLGREIYFLNQFNQNTNKLASVNIQNSIIYGTPRLVIEFFAICSVATIIFTFLILGKSIIEILPTLGLFFVAAYKMIPSFNKVLLMMNRLKYSTDTARRILTVLEEFSLDKNIKLKENSSNSLSFNKDIKIENISFKYPKRPQQILENINLIIQKNSFVGIGGESGSGKSTLIDIIMGIQNPNSGKVLVDDKSIKDALNNWQKKIGYVSQAIYIAPDTIKKNIAFGIPDEKIDNDLINEVIKKCSLEKFINSLEFGLDTHIGEGGSLISGGQKQRIGIARALYDKPEVLVFDEATSALDSDIEQEILNEIYKLKKEFTLIFITHRERALRFCDEKYLLKNKKLIKN
tara:strand:- start:19 stop:1767 length:1749 start_codon:yes stop_codon:yes gene_type:complete